jgi:hypothetical protein
MLADGALGCGQKIRRVFRIETWLAEESLHAKKPLAAKTPEKIREARER